VTRAFAALAAAALLAGCGGSGDDDAETTVFAASSLADVAPRVDREATVVLGGSNDLAAQIRDGADADVFLSASAKPIEELGDLLEEPIAFASNRLVLVVPRANPSGTKELADLTRAGVKLVLGADGVPVGDYAREALVAAGLEEALAQVVSLEEDVKGVLGKVALGEADAGIVYATDARAAGDEVRALPLPDDLQPDIRYHAALVAPATAAGRAYLDRLLGPEGAEALRDAGFLPAP